MNRAPHVSAQEQRENPDPHENTRPVPRGLLALAALVFTFCVSYLAGAEVGTPAAWGDGRQAAELSGGAARADGAALFASTCAPCHQATGLGLPGVFPPLAGSEWVLGRDTTLAAIVLHGVQGSLTVKGQTFQGAMPAFGAKLTDDQLAALLTYLRTRSDWGHAAAPVSAQTVAQVRQAHQARTGPFAGQAELPPHD